MTVSATYRKARPEDADFCVETIMQAESSNSRIQPWTSIMGMEENEIRQILKQIVLSDIAGQEFSLSAFTIAEYNGKPAGACGCWIEECEDIPSSHLKTDILNYYFPASVLKRAEPVLQKLHTFQYPKFIHCAYFEYLYIIPEFRSIDLLLHLLEESSSAAISAYPHIHVPAIYGGTSGTNPFMIRATGRIGYKLWKTIVLEDESLLKYIPSLTRYVMKKTRNDDNK
jgi:hypothetical protein